MKQTITFTIQVDVDAEAAARLPGYPGTGNPATAYGDEDVPISGLDIEAAVIASELARVVKEMLPSKLSPSGYLRDYSIAGAKSLEASVF